jgi:hypothetical protein
MIHKNKLSEDYKDSSLPVEKRIESVGNNLGIVSSELELHQNQLYFIKKGIVFKAMSFYQDAHVDIRENLIEAFQEMEYAFITNDISGFCSAVYRQLEIFCNHSLFVSKKLNDNISFDSSTQKCAVQPSNGLNRLTGSFVWDSSLKNKKFIDFSVSADKQKYFSAYYLQTVAKSGKCELKITFANKLNLLYGFHIHKAESNPKDKSVVYYFYNNNFMLTSKVKDIRDAKEHGIKSTHLSNWTTKDYFESFKVLNDLYHKIPDLK